MKLGAPPLWLASGSPRRSQLLTEAGIEFQVRSPEVDESRLSPGGLSVEAWTMALAYLKARRVADDLVAEGCDCGTVLAADTLCLHQDQILGKPEDADHARDMLQRLRGDQHQAVTGVCLIDLARFSHQHLLRLRRPPPRDDVGERGGPASGERLLFADTSRVRLGEIDDAELEAYVASGQWRGKAGGYNLSDRLEAGWPIEYDGDIATVMGLPMQRLEPHLRRTSS